MEDGVGPALLPLLLHGLLGDAVLASVLPGVRDARDPPLLLHVLLPLVFPPGPGGPCSHMPAINFTLAVRPEMGLAGCAGGAGGPPVGALHGAGDLVAP